MDELTKNSIIPITTTTEGVNFDQFTVAVRNSESAISARNVNEMAGEINRIGSQGEVGESGARRDSWASRVTRQKVICL